MLLPAAADRALQGLGGNVGTGVSAAWGGGFLCLAWSGDSVLKEAGGEKTLRDGKCNALAPG